MRLVILLLAALTATWLAAPASAGSVRCQGDSNNGSSCPCKIEPNGSCQGTTIWHLSATDFSVQGINLSKSKINSLELRHVDLIGANLSEISTKSGLFDSVDMIQANLSNASLERAKFWRAKLGGANFSNSDLRGAEFNESRLNSTSFAGADLREAIFRNPIFRQTDFTGATWVDGSKCGPGSIDRCIPVTVTGTRSGMALPSPGLPTIVPHAGMWRTPGGSEGYVLEPAMAGALRVIVVGFDAAGIPTWTMAEGTIGPDNLFTAALRRCTAGTTPAGTKDCTGELGQISLQFADNDSATLLALGAAPVSIAPAPIP